jgi:hypothetical protein
LPRFAHGDGGRRLLGERGCGGEECKGEQECAGGIHL